MSINYKSITLNNGITMPNFGLGTWLSDTGLVQKAVECAIDAGYRHIDCAYCYGNENEVGAAIKNKIAEGVVKREDLFITSKLWNTFHRQEHVEYALDLTLRDLGLEYIDLYLIHWPAAMQFQDEDRGFGNADGMRFDNGAHYLDTWKAMEAVYASKKTRAIGVSNFNLFQMKNLLSNCTTVPVMNQIELHAYNTQAELVNYCASQNVNVTAYSPLGAPSRPEKLQTGQPVLMENQVIKDIAVKYSKSAAQICIKFSLARGLICIPKSTTPARIVANAEIFDFELTADEVKAVMALNSDTRYVAAGGFKGSKWYPFVENYSE